MKENNAKVNRKSKLGDDSGMLLAGDIGGTKTLLGVFEASGLRPRPIAVRAFSTLDYPDLSSMISVFANDGAVRGVKVRSACFGVAGPVLGEVAELTNVPWQVDARHVAETFDIRRVTLLNDLQAMAHAVPFLEPAEVHVLQPGERRPGGHMALIAAGTGLGEAFLHWVDGRFIPAPSEGGHADFAARTEGEVAVLRELVRRYGRAEVEHVVSGRGLVNVHRVMHADACVTVADLDDPDAPAAISTAALEQRCRGCMAAFAIFVEAYGAEAGNLALRTVATGGLFIGGGIAPKILSALDDGRFMRAFRDKAPLDSLVAGIPVNVILNTEAALVGAAIYAAQT